MFRLRAAASCWGGVRRGVERGGLSRAGGRAVRPGNGLGAEDDEVGVVGEGVDGLGGGGTAGAVGEGGDKKLGG